MSYRKVINYGVDRNLDVHKVKRHHYSKEMIELMAKETRILNIDESSYDKWEYNYLSWCKKGQRNTQKQVRIVPAVSLIAVTDSNGNIYSSLHQSNSNENTTMLVITELVSILDIEDDCWRENSVLLLDNCRPHKSKNVQKLLRDLRVPTLFASPYSANQCPVEMIFSQLKKGDHNPQKRKTTKS